ncbi:MAG: hypothetical protein ABJF11_15135 [Reichenbachiella sp.]
MKFRSELGYTGDWKKGKRHGVGTYVRKNDQGYVRE